jgi:rare lipoprotein A
VRRSLIILQGALLLLGTISATGCGGSRPVAHRPPARTPPAGTPPSGTPSGTPAGTPSAKPPGAGAGAGAAHPSSPRPYVEEGVASWYGIPYHGRQASNGEIYDMYKMTAAHRTLPFETVVRVTNLKNGKSTEVRINDRGPFVEGRIIDLSLGAARAIDMVGMGIAPVRVEVLSGSDPYSGSFTVQVGAFRVKENALRFQHDLDKHYASTSIVEYDSPQGLFYRVRAGKLPGEEAARAFAEQVRREKGIVPFVVRLDEAQPQQ